MTHTIAASDPITIEIPSRSDFKLNMHTVHDAIQLATMITFDDWMDQTHATGSWPAGANGQPERDYRLLNAADTPLALKFNTAIHVFYQKGILIHTL